MAPTQQTWTSPTAEPTGLDPQRPSFGSSTPLGGAPPAPSAEPDKSDTRTLVVAGLLLVLAVAVALASLLSWRDFGTGLNPDESGWVMADGTLGRGWVAIAIAILLAAGGALLVAGRRRLGLILARIGAVALIVFPAIEWSFGMRNTTSGPGLGLWVLLVIGAAMILFMGSILGEDPDSNSH